MYLVITRLAYIFSSRPMKLVVTDICCGIDQDIYLVFVSSKQHGFRDLNLYKARLRLEPLLNLCLVFHLHFFL